MLCCASIGRRQSRRVSWRSAAERNRRSALARVGAMRCAEPPYRFQISERPLHRQADAEAGSRSGLLSTSIRPPCSLMMPWQMVRPRPVPVPGRLGREEGVEDLGEQSGGMPQPSSSTSTTISPSLSRRHQDSSLTMPRGLDRLHAVHQEIEEDLVEVRDSRLQQGQPAEAGVRRGCARGTGVRRASPGTGRSTR